MHTLKILLVYLALISGIAPPIIAGGGYEHLPYGLMLGIISFYATKRSLLLLISILIFSIYSALYYSLFQEGGHLLYLIQALNFLSPLFFVKHNESLILKIAINVFWLYIFIGILQFIHFLTPVEELIRLFIPRFHGEPIGGYRGVTMLESEPARASFQLIMLYFVATCRMKKKGLYLFALGLSQFVLINSATGIILFTIILSVTYWNILLSNKKYFLLILAIPPLIYFYGLNNPKIELILHNYNEYSFLGFYNSLAATSGGRFLGFTNTLIDILKWPFGYGLDPNYFTNERESIGNLSIAGYQAKDMNRSVSAILTFVRTYGIIFVFFVWLSLPKDVRRNINSSQAFSILLTASIYSPPGSEIVLIALILKLQRQPRRTTSYHFVKAKN